LTRSWKKIQRGYEENARSCSWVSVLPKQSQSVADQLEGSGESGKSTIVKQMKIIHQNGYTVDELALYRLTVFKNVVDCAKALIGAMRQFEVEPAEEKNKEFSDFLMEYQVDPDPNTPLDPKVGDAISSLLSDANIPKIMEHQTEFYLMDSAP
jgi:guanine nucleotide-binding protein G(i) subunit alpha